MSDAAYTVIYILILGMVNQQKVCMHTCIHAAWANLYFLCLYTFVQLSEVAASWMNTVECIMMKCAHLHSAVQL